MARYCERCEGTSEEQLFCPRCYAKFKRKAEEYDKLQEETTKLKEQYTAMSNDMKKMIDLLSDALNREAKLAIGFKKLDMFIRTKVNKVTCFHRHRNKIPEQALVELSNGQIDMEEFSRKILLELVELTEVKDE